MFLLTPGFFLSYSISFHGSFFINPVFALYQHWKHTKGLTTCILNRVTVCAMHSVLHCRLYRGQSVAFCRQNLSWFFGFIAIDNFSSFNKRRFLFLWSRSLFGEKEERSIIFYSFFFEKEIKIIDKIFTK